MEISEYLQFLAVLVVRQIPLLVVAAIGLRYAFARRESLGPASAWARWGFTLLIAYAFVSVVISLLITQIQIGQIASVERAESIGRLGLWILAAYPVFIAGLAALARAIFLGRDVESSGASARRAVNSIESGVPVVRS